MKIFLRVRFARLNLKRKMARSLFAREKKLADCLSNLLSNKFSNKKLDFLLFV